MQPLLEIKKLAVVHKSQHKLDPILKDINFQILPKQTLVLLGETGSGKSVTALSILRLLEPSLWMMRHSEILLEGEDLLLLSEIAMRKVRGRKIGMIFQDPATSFNPVLTIGQQIEEVLKLHRYLSGKPARLQALHLLELVQLEHKDRVYHSYPHQLSGGMKQRAMIAMALAGDPKLLIADEATTALDVITENQILTLLKQIQAELGMGIVFITHNLNVAAKMADTIAILKNGELVEQGDKQQILEHPTHPYTQKLINAQPSLTKPFVSSECETVLSVNNLQIHFGSRKEKVLAVEDVSLSLREGETLAIVGGSGSGKTTLAKGIMGLLDKDRGEVSILGKNLNKLSARQLRRKRSEFQMIFQEPMSAMDPRFTVKDILEEGMLALEIGGSSKAERKERMFYLLDQVGLLPEHLSRYPHQLSGGQRQRVCIARALAVGPTLWVCDEPTSSLDRSVQAQMIDLLLSLQEEYEIAYLLITHDFSVVRAMAHRVAVMQSGKIVEYGLVGEVLNAPRHEYTRALLDAAGVEN